MANISELAVHTLRFVEAARFAGCAHRFQSRKDGTPYLAHLLTVSALVWEVGGSEDAAIAALLHDAVEDVGVTVENIREAFGYEVARLVSALTEKKELERADRKVAYIEVIRKADSTVKLISAADKLHNLRCYSRQPELWKPDVEDFYFELMKIFAGEEAVPRYWIAEFNERFEKLALESAFTRTVSLPVKEAWKEDYLKTIGW